MMTNAPVKRIYRWLQHPRASLAALFGLLVVVPVCLRVANGWADPLGYLSDVGLGGALVVLLYRRPVWLAVPVVLAWGALSLASAELVAAVGRLPTPADLHYLTDVQFMENSAGGSLANPGFAIALGLGLLLWLATRWAARARPVAPLPRHLWAVPVTCLLVHAGTQAWEPAEADEWQVFNLPHQLLAVGVGESQARIEDWLEADVVDPPVAMAGLTRLDLSGKPLLDAPGSARNVLVVALEGIPGAYLDINRRTLNPAYQEHLMPKLSAWAERAMNTPDYVLHTHQTIRGLYAMLCGDYDKLDNGTPKGVEMLTQNQRNQECLPAQLREHGFSTHYLQGAGLRFMAKDKIMPHIGFDTTLGLDWFKNPNYLDFPWGKDDKAFFEGALDYVGQLQKQPEPWMLTLLTVGTHQPYSAPAEYLERYATPKQAAVAYLDDAVDNFLAGLERQGVLKDTLVVITSDESHGIDGVRLASSWGFNLMLAPEQAQLPQVKSGVYGHVDLTASVLDYFGFPVPNALSGRSLLRDYDNGREIMSFTNGKLRYHDGNATFTECDFQQRCRSYASTGFIAERANLTDRFRGQRARQVQARASALDQSVMGSPLNQHYQFGSATVIPLQPQIKDDWADNLIGAQYLEMPKGSHTRVRLTVRSADPQQNAYIVLKTKEFEQEVLVGLPTEEMLVTPDQPLEMEFTFDNNESRKAFSFHLLGHGLGAVEVSDFSVVTEAPGQIDELDETLARLNGKPS